MNLTSLFAPRPRVYNIDNAALARVLRDKFYGPVPDELPHCDRCRAPDAPVMCGALNYCDACWKAVVSR